MSDLSFAPVTGGGDLPDGNLPAGTVLVLRLTLPDSEGGTVVPDTPFAVTLEADGLLPAGWTLWRNSRGSAGSAYIIDAVVPEAGPSGATLRRTRRLGVVRVDEAASYTLGGLLRAAVVPAPPGAEVAADIPAESFSGTTYTAALADQGKAKESTSGSAVAVTLPNSLPAGWSCLYMQGAAGQLTFGAASGATIRQAQGLTKTYAQWSEVWVRVRANATGTSAEYVLSGDMV